jgi:hypothetical protein
MSALFRYSASCMARLLDQGWKKLENFVHYWIVMITHVTLTFYVILCCKGLNWRFLSLWVDDIGSALVSYCVSPRKKLKMARKCVNLKFFFWQRIGSVCRNCYQNYANTVFIHTISLNIHVHVYILKIFGRVCAFRGGVGVRMWREIQFWRQNPTSFWKDLLNPIPLLRART